jgi:hypothetical protein
VVFITDHSHAAGSLADRPAFNSALTTNVSSAAGPLHSRPAPQQPTHNNEWTALISDTQFIQTILSPEYSGADLGYSRADIEKIAAEASHTLGYDVEYSAESIQKLGLREFKKEDYDMNDACLKHQSVEAIIGKAIDKLRLSSSTPKLEAMEGVSNYERLNELLTTGQRKFMKPEFTPNGKMKRFSTSYIQKYQICNDSMIEDMRAGRTIVFSMKALEESREISKLHFNSTTWAPKAGKILGRVCINASSGDPSLNESVDLDAHDLHYPSYSLPSFRDIAEMACEQRDAHPGQQLSGAVIDVAKAYKQTLQTVDTAKLFCVPIYTRDENGHVQILVAINLAGVFGFTRSGHVYCTCAKAIDEKHNAGPGPQRSRTYIDDGLLVDTAVKMPASVKDYTSQVTNLFGPDGIQTEKIKLTEGQLEGIGWFFDLNAWTITPKSKGLAKLLVYLFIRIPVGSTSVRRETLDQAIGVMNWYADGLPSGKSHLSSLYACLRRARITGTGSTPLSEGAQLDLKWWRAMVLVAHRRPALVSASIDHARCTRVPTIFLRTDAAKTIGGGGFLSLTQGGVPIILPGDAIRWTRVELNAFAELEVSINVIEFFTSVYYILLWGTHLRGQIVMVESDNTAAVSWLMKKRSVSSPCADIIARILNLFCLSHNICIVSQHIPGVENTLADFLSRDLVYLNQGSDEWVMPSGNEYASCSRAELLRRLLYLSVTSPSELRLRPVLKALMQLDTDLG